jgi:NAD(P)-dependent dehydrogenase (short-subunit alcohol dehydrogenase family)
MSTDRSSVLITGGASGIGLAAARRLSAEGAQIVITDVQAKLGEEAAAEVGGVFHSLDVSDRQQWAAAVRVALDAFGRLDVVLLNAGIALGEPDPLKVDAAAYRRIMGVNVDGVVFGVQAVAPALGDSGGGAIVATASLGGLTPMPTDPVYSLTKHAVVAFVRSAAPALAERGITFNAVCPGFTETPLLNEEFQRLVTSMAVPLISAEAVADAISQILASGDTGQAWYVQAGREPAPYQFRGVPGPKTPA